MKQSILHTCGHFVLYDIEDSKVLEITNAYSQRTCRDCFYERMEQLVEKGEYKIVTISYRRYRRYKDVGIRLYQTKNGYDKKTKRVTVYAPLEAKLILW